MARIETGRTAAILFLPLLIWGLAPIWALGFDRIRTGGSRRDRLATAPLWIAEPGMDAAALGHSGMDGLHQDRRGLRP